MNALQTKIDDSPLSDAAAIKARLLNHPIYAALDAPEKIRVFMQHHVFAVWDFMSLLKRLQRDLTCVAIPWSAKLPPEETKFARFINEIVLGEETDEDGAGGAISHFDLYLQAMRECGADTLPIQRFVESLNLNGDLGTALTAANAPETVRQFVRNTLDIAFNGATHEVCAAFFYGREELIPDMFQVIVDELGRRDQTPERLLYYLNRHIEMDGDEHGPLAEKMLRYLCGDDAARIAETEATARQCLESRIKLWDGVCTELNAEKSVVAAAY